jgi:hypothetical protein
VREMCDFIKTSQRGIAGYVRQRQGEDWSFTGVRFTKVVWIPKPIAFIFSES